MRKKILLVSYASALLLVHCLLACLALAVSSTNLADESSLLALKSHITFDPNNILATNWSTTTSYCNWIGVSCNTSTPHGHQRVIALNLSSMGFEGSIAPQVGNLSFLLSLDISNNYFHGRFPDEIGKLHSLQQLFVQDNHISGSIPSIVANCKELRMLAMFNNELTGSIPQVIRNLSKLEKLYLGANHLTGAIPKEISYLLNLKVLSVPANNLSDSIPSSIFNISSLRSIDLMNNSLSGTLPIDMCSSLSKLEVLSLSRNQLSKQIPTSLLKCQELKQISLSFNEFMGSIPRGIGNLSKLEELYINHNKLTGEIPEALFNISSLRVVCVAKNNLLGTLPRGICYTLPRLEIISISWNQLKDEDMVAHVGDFGIAKLLMGNETMVQTKTFGTIGYMAPEYGSEGMVSTRGDVYSYGIMLMETFTRKKPIENMFAGELNLKSWVESFASSIIDVVDANILPREDEHFTTKEKCVSSIITLALECTTLQPEERINMKDVVTRLKKIRIKLSV